MRAVLFGCLAVGLVFGPAAHACARDTAQAIVDRAVKAHGGADKLEKYKGSRSKGKGTVEIQGNSHRFTQETVTLLPDKFKEALEIEVGGQKIPVVTVYNGKEGWVSANGMTTEMSETMLKEVKEVLYLANLMRLLARKDPACRLTSLPETKVQGRPAVGVKVTHKDQRDVSLYFDKDKGLFVKSQRKGIDPMSGQDFTEERIITEHQEVGGLKIARKLLIQRDGFRFMEIEISDVKLLDSVDEGEFKKP